MQSPLQRLEQWLCWVFFFFDLPLGKRLDRERSLRLRA